MSKLILIAIIFLSSFTGCTKYAMRVNTHIKGDSITNTDMVYHNEVYHSLRRPAPEPNTRPGMIDGVCYAQIMPVTRRTLYKSKDFQIEKNYKLPQHGMVAGKVIEEWTIEGCGIKTPWYLTFEVNDGRRLPVVFSPTQPDLSKSQ